MTDTPQPAVVDLDALESAAQLGVSLDGDGDYVYELEPRKLLSLLDALDEREREMQP